MGHKDGFCSPAKRGTRTKSSMRHSKGQTKQRIRADAIIRISNIDCKYYRLYATVTVDNHAVNFQVDTASDITVISHKTWSHMGKPRLEPSTLIAQSASGDRIHFSGQRQCNYSFKGVSAPGMFYVANTHTNVLGAEWITNLKIYSMMYTLPSMEPDQPEDTLNTSVIESNDDIAAQLQRQFPEAFSTDLGLYKHSAAMFSI
ncbi:unnamed protein product [Heligmosomoides polygyrus]|uniref:Peptidase A2 domain-containing protein n=1 Tax=Heligmosomoides polygyrus TaxID=6339 RepID=A0A183GJD5_HELPZ|nr:unnamed protein product [Heligmosomoides polygyrus]